MRTLFHTRRALALLTAVIAVGCGMRTSIQAEADAVDDGPLADGGSTRPCGHGPPCNPSNLGGRTCESLGLPSGVLSCEPDTCNLDISRCGNALVDGGRPNPVGSGSPGTPGLFGATAGTGAGTFGGGQSGVFGTGGDAGFFGGGLGDGGFFGQGNNPGGNNPDEDGGTDGPGGGPNSGTGGTGTGFFGSGFFGGTGGTGGFFGSGFFGGQ